MSWSHKSNIPLTFFRSSRSTLMFFYILVTYLHSRQTWILCVTFELVKWSKSDSYVQRIQTNVCRLQKHNKQFTFISHIMKKMEWLLKLNYIFIESRTPQTPNRWNKIIFRTLFRIGLLCKIKTKTVINVRLLSGKENWIWRLHMNFGMERIVMFFFWNWIPHCMLANEIAFNWFVRSIGAASIFGLNCMFRL